MTAAIEFFCGIGGFTHSLPPGFHATGIDINRAALALYERGTGGRGLCRTIESLTPDDLAAIEPDAGIWWLSPPCQPFTHQGQRRDLDDPRCQALINVCRLIEALRPPIIAMENVPPFQHSSAFGRVVQALERSGYHWRCMEMCPTELGSWNRRPRWYLLARRGEELPPAPPIVHFREECLASRRPMLETLEDSVIEAYRVPEFALHRYKDRLHIVQREEFLEGKGTTRCFTASYGRSLLRSGSCLADDGGVRFFTPREILWQLGFGSQIDWGDAEPRKLWPLVGNSLAQDVVRYLIRWMDLTPASAEPGPVKLPAACHCIGL